MAHTLVLLQPTYLFMNSLVNFLHQNYLSKSFIKFTTYTHIVLLYEQPLASLHLGFNNEWKKKTFSQSIYDN